MLATLQYLYNLFFTFILPGEDLGPALFIVRGNQGQSWKPAEVHFEGTAATHVNILTRCSYFCMHMPFDLRSFASSVSMHFSL